jgi:hypothetical protein
MVKRDFWKTNHIIKYNQNFRGMGIFLILCSIAYTKKTNKAKHMTAEFAPPARDIEVSPKNPNTNWVALDKLYNILAEGETPEEVIGKAQQITNEFTLMFTPKEGSTYIF